MQELKPEMNIKRGYGSYQGAMEKAIRKIKEGSVLEARQLIKLILERFPHDEMAWIWFAETFSSDSDRLRILSLFLKKQPNSSVAGKAVELLREKLQIIEAEGQLDPLMDQPAGETVIPQREMISQDDMDDGVEQERERVAEPMVIILAILTILITIMLAVLWTLIK